MTTRKIIKIDESLCNGCGECVTGCSEGALAIVDGKAKLVNDSFCDGFGDCIGACPTGALTIEERPASAFDLEGIKQHLLQTQGKEAVWRMEEAQQRHQALASDKTSHHGCPGVKVMLSAPKASVRPKSGASEIGTEPFRLKQWPIHLRLVQPQAAFFKQKEMVVMSTCGPLALADVHERYLHDRSLVVACPKLDDSRDYVAKLADIFQESTISRVIIPRMEVPCCSGLTRMVLMAQQLAGRDDLMIEEHIIGIDGTVREQNS